MALHSNWEGFLRFNLISVPVRSYSAAVTEHERSAVGQVVFAGREQLVLLRPLDGLLAMTMLSYDSQVKKPTSFEDEAPEVEITDKELKLAESLVEASTADHFDFSQYHDTYTSKLKELIEAKTSGRKIVAPRSTQEEPHVINLMDALRRSLDEVQKGQKPGKPHREKRSHKQRATPTRRRTG